MGIAKAATGLIAVSSVLLLLGDLHHTKIPPAGAVLGLGAEVALLETVSQVYSGGRLGAIFCVPVLTY